MVVERLHLLHEARLKKGAAVGHDGHGLRHLQRRDLGVPLTDRQVCDVTVEQSAAVCRLHVFVVGHASFHLAPQRDAALRAKAQLERPINDRRGAGFDSDLIKPRVARFGERLNKIQSAAIAFFPVVKREIADLDGRHAFVGVVRSDRTAFQRRDTDRDLKCRSWRIR